MANIRQSMFLPGYSRLFPCGLFVPTNIYSPIYRVNLNFIREHASYLNSFDKQMNPLRLVGDKSEKVEI